MRKISLIKNIGYGLIISGIVMSLSFNLNQSLGRIFISGLLVITGFSLLLISVIFQRDLSKKKSRIILLCLLVLLIAVFQAFFMNEIQIFKHRNLANNYLKQGNYTQAIIEYAKVIKINPKGAIGDIELAYNLRGLDFAKQGKLTQAVSDLTMCLKINPNNQFVYYSRGKIYFQQGILTQALLDFNKAIEIDPTLAVLYEERGKVYSKVKEYDKAWTDVHKAEFLGYKPDNEDLKFLGDLKKASGRNQ